MTFFWKIAHWCYRYRALYPLARLFEFLNYWICSNAISAKATIGDGTKFWHRGLGCVVHYNAVIGKNCKIFPNVMIGVSGSNGIVDAKAPKIGNDVFIGTGAIVAGGGTVGDHAVIAASAVVLHDVKQGERVAGVPAKRI